MYLRINIFHLLFACKNVKEFLNKVNLNLFLCPV